MKKKEISTNYQLSKSDNDPVRRGDNITLTRKIKPRSPEPGVVLPPKPPRKSLDERITEALTKALKPVVSRLDGIESDIQMINTRLDNIDTRLDKQDEFNQVVTNYMKSHP